MNVITEAAAAHATPALDPLRADLARLDAVLAPALAAVGFDWPAAAAVGRRPLFALPGLRRAITEFALSPFEADVLLLALSAEVDDRYAAAFAALQGNPTLVRPSIGTVLRLLGSQIRDGQAAAFSALAPDGRLHEARLIRLVGDGPHPTRTISLPQAVWLQLVHDRPTGRFASTPRGEGIASLVLAQSTAMRAAVAIRIARERGAAPLIALHGRSGRTSLARAIGFDIGTGIIPCDPSVLDDSSACGDLARDATWWQSTIVVTPSAPPAALARLCRDSPGVAIIAAVEAAQLTDLLATAGRRVIEISIDDLDHAGRCRAWRAVGAEESGVDVALLASRYRFGPSRVATSMSIARARAETRGAATVNAEDILAACRSTGGLGLSSLAHRLDTPHADDDLVVPPATRRELQLLDAAAREGHRLFGPDTPAAKLRGAAGLVALFAGPSGTGKTMAAQVIARRLDLTLLRIDLSQVVNKYIGETEKHLDKVFREGEDSGAILFFDEAEALFSKRTEIKDAHDRYANVETAYLLQRLEMHPGIAILATNFKQNLDAAFMRRLQLVIDFPLPGETERRAIWERHLAAVHLGDDLDVGFLGRFALSGGDIRNAVITAVLLGAAAERVVMRHLVIAVWREVHKAGRLTQIEEFGDWRETVIAYSRATEFAHP